MYIHWKEARLITVNLKDQKLPIKILPGAQLISEKDWEAIKDQPLIKIYLDEDKLEVIKGTEKNDVPAPAKKMTDLKVREAEKMIKVTFDPEMLKTWLAEDNREGVKSAINAQLKHIEEQTKINEEK